MSMKQKIYNTWIKERLWNFNKFHVQKVDKKLETSNNFHVHEVENVSLENSYQFHVHKVQNPLGNWYKFYVHVPVKVLIETLMNFIRSGRFEILWYDNTLCLQSGKSSIRKLYLASKFHVHEVENLWSENSKKFHVREVETVNSNKFHTHEVIKN